MQDQEEDLGITEQDLELIKERESAIKKLEVWHCSKTFVCGFLMLLDKGLYA